MINSNSSKEVILAAVSQDGLALEHASDTLKADREVVLAAVHQNGTVIEVLPDSLKADITFFWSVKLAMTSQKYPEIVDNYINSFMAKEALKLFVSFGMVAIGGLMLGGIITLPLPDLAVSLLGAVAVGFSGGYVSHKIKSYHQSFFNYHKENAALSSSLESYSGA